MPAITSYHIPKGKMPNGSSIWTPISSMPSRRKAMMAEAGTIAQWQDFQSVKGINTSQITRNLDVCLRCSQLQQVA